MKKIDIIYSDSLSAVQGINNVNNSFVLAKKIFQESGLQLRKIYSSSTIFDILTNEKLTTIGERNEMISYKCERKIRSRLTKLLSSEYVIFAIMKFFWNNIRNAKKCVRNYLSKQEPEADFLIFQDVFSAFHFYSKGLVKNAKTILILHSGEDPIDMFWEAFPGLKNNRFTKEYIENIYAKACNSVDKVVFLSKRASDNCILNIEQAKKAYIFNGVADLDLQLMHHINENIYKIVEVASVVPRKGQSYVIEAFSLLPEEILNRLHFYIVGDGEFKTKLESDVMSKKMDKHITFLGVRTDVPTILQEMDIFILPSAMEGMPMSIIEALRQGLYILASDIGGCNQMVGEGFGSIISRDPKNISETLISIVKDRKVSSSSQLLSRKHYEQNFTLYAMVSKYIQLFNSL